MGTTVLLQPVDAVEVTVLVDNAVDILLPSGEVARGPRSTTGCSRARR